MLNLPKITLLGIDCIHPVKTLKAMRFSMRQVKFSEAVLVTDCADRFVVEACEKAGVKPVHHVTDERIDHERDMLKYTPEWFDTEYCLYQEWDAAVMNPRAWKSWFMDYDYIGAPWVLGMTEQGYPECEEWNCVGNGGFALKSKRFAEAISRLVDDADPLVALSDVWMCRTVRKQMAMIGMKYAPESLAENFSCEDRFYSGQFGLHGDNTIKMNNLDWSFSWL